MARPRTDVVVVSAIVAGWAATVAGSLAGWRHVAGHDHVIEGGGSWLVGVWVFVVGWQVMVAAMMLPSSLPAIRWFRSLEGIAEAPRRRTGAFLAGYGGTWTVVGLGALAGDVLVHEASHRLGWLATRPWAIAAGALLVAGAFQLSRWSRRCREPEPAYVRGSVPGHVGTGRAWALGADHARVRLWDCWPVMLVSFAFGMTSVAWMAGLTVLMTIERIPRFAPRAAVGSGVAFLACAGLILVQPGWLVGI
jgi:predicted metal-binding membrane protein